MKNVGGRFLLENNSESPKKIFCACIQIGRNRLDDKRKIDIEGDFYNFFYFSRSNAKAGWSPFQSLLAPDTLAPKIFYETESQCILSFIHFNAVRMAEMIKFRRRRITSPKKLRRKWNRFSATVSVAFTL